MYIVFKKATVLCIVLLTTAKQRWRLFCSDFHVTVSAQIELARWVCLAFVFIFLFGSVFVCNYQFNEHFLIRPSNRKQQKPKQLSNSLCASLVCACKFFGKQNTKQKKNIHINIERSRDGWFVVPKWYDICLAGTWFSAKLMPSLRLITFIRIIRKTETKKSLIFCASFHSLFTRYAVSFLVIRWLQFWLKMFWAALKHYPLYITSCDDNESVWCLMRTWQ